MKAKYVNPFLRSVAQILEQVVGIKVEKGDISKNEGLASDRLYTMYFHLENGLDGFFAISFDEEVALNLVEKMIGVKPENLDEMGYSALKEIGEMVKGNAITELSTEGIDCEGTETKFVEENTEISGDSISLVMESELGQIKNIFYIKK